VISTPYLAAGDLTGPMEKGMTNMVRPRIAPSYSDCEGMGMAQQ
jgi:hypothetical protein